MTRKQRWAKDIALICKNNANAVNRGNAIRTYITKAHLPLNYAQAFTQRYLGSAI